MEIKQLLINLAELEYKLIECIQVEDYKALIEILSLHAEMLDEISKLV